MKQTITRSEAAKYLGISYVGVVQYIRQGKLTDIPADDDTNKKKLFAKEVIALKKARDTRRERLDAKTNKKYYTGGPYCPFDIRVILDPDDCSGLTHLYFISRKAYDDMNTGIRTWDEIKADEIFSEKVFDRLPLPKAEKV